MTGFGYNVNGFGAVGGEGVPPFITATGGTITTDGDYKVHTFNSSGTFEVTTLPETPSVAILQIAGGASGGAGDFGGGGGAGGYIYDSDVTVAQTTYTVTIGAGGTDTGGAGVFTHLRGKIIE